ncbi:MAG: metal ABC transporter permease [Candidatus Glassbacteria bacterium]
MSTPQIEIQLIASVVAATCALPGVFLILRRMAMMSDAISHAILLGIVLAFFVTKDITSPLLVIAATLTGVFTVSLVEMLNRTQLVKEDAAIGIVFPVLFSIGVILISRYAGSVHLDTDAVLLGELAFAPFNRFIVLGHDLGPKSLYVMGTILLLNVIFIAVFFKELKLATFDSGLAAALGFSPGLIHYCLMTLVSVTAVGAFDAVGSILVVALMIAPPATAYLLTDRLTGMVILSALIGVVCALSGYWLAHALDASIAGSMATVTGILFFTTFLLAPTRGLIPLARRRSRQKREFAVSMLTVHLCHHEGLAEAAYENQIDHLHRFLKWDVSFTDQVVKRAERDALIVRDDGLLKLTVKGREFARRAMSV